MRDTADSTVLAYVVVVVVLLFLGLLVAFWTAVVAGGLDTHHITVPGGRAHGGQPK